MGIFYHSKVKFTMVNTIFKCDHFFNFTMVNEHLVCCDSNGSRMKEKFTIVNPLKRHGLVCIYLNFVYISDSQHIIAGLNLK